MLSHHHHRLLLITSLVAVLATVIALVVSTSSSNSFFFVNAQRGDNLYPDLTDSDLRQMLDEAKISYHAQASRFELARLYQQYEANPSAALAANNNNKNRIRKSGRGHTLRASLCTG